MNELRMRGIGNQRSWGLEKLGTVEELGIREVGNQGSWEIFNVETLRVGNFRRVVNYRINMNTMNYVEQLTTEQLKYNCCG